MNISNVNFKRFLVSTKNSKINIDKLGYYLFSIGVFLLVSTPFISALLFLISSILSTMRNKKLFFKDRINLILLLTSLIIIISSILNYFQSPSLVNNISIDFNMFAGLTNYLPLFWFFWSSQHYLKTSEKRRTIALLFISGTFPIFISQIMQYNLVAWNIPTPLSTLNGLVLWFMKPSPELYGYAGIFSNSNYLAAWLSIVLPFSIASLLEKHKKFKNLFASFIFLILICASLIICFSRMGALSIPLHLTILFSNDILLIIIFMICLFTILILLNLFFLNAFFISTLNLFSKFQDNFFVEILFNNVLNTPRFNICVDTIKIIAQRPLIGWGTSTYKEVYKLLGTRTNISHAHNLPLEIAYNFGIIPSLLLIIIFLFITLKSIYLELKIKNINSNLYRCKYKSSFYIFNKAWISSAIVLGISQLVDIQYYDLRISLGFWIILGGLRAYIYEMSDKKLSISKNF